MCAHRWVINNVCIYIIHILQSHVCVHTGDLSTTVCTFHILYVYGVYVLCIYTYYDYIYYIYTYIVHRCVHTDG